MKRDEQALLYQFKDEGRIAVVEKTLHRLGIKTRIIPPDAYQQKVGYLLGRKGFRPLPAEVDGFIFPHEVLLLDNIKGKRLDAVLAALQESVRPGLHYKAVVTPFNSFWTLRRLCETMQKEHSFMIAQEKEKERRGQAHEKE